MVLEEIPDGLRGVQIVTGFAHQENRQVLWSAGPGMASTIDGVNDNLGALPATRINFALDCGSVVRLIGKIVCCGSRRSKVPLAPEILRFSQRNRYAAIAQHWATINMHQRIFRSV